MKILNYSDKATLLRKAREKGEIAYKGAKISLYQDFSPDLQRQRAAFRPIKRILQQHKVTYALLYPARLRVTTADGIRLFDSPIRVEKWLEENKRET